MSFAEYIARPGIKYGNMLKKRVRGENLIPYVCAICTIGPKWNGTELVLQLDHIDGQRENNQISNLRFLCPNCHSQTPTFTGRNNKRPAKRCIDCNKIIERRALRCRGCNAFHSRTKPRLKRRKVIRPSKMELKGLITTTTFVAIGKQYDVCDNTVRKWCKMYKLPYKRSEINKCT